MRFKIFLPALFVILSLLTSGCSIPRHVKTEYDTGPYVKTEELREYSTTESTIEVLYHDNALRSQLEVIPRDSKVTKAKVADVHNKKQIDTYTKCTAADYVMWPFKVVISPIMLLVGGWEFVFFCPDGREEETTVLADQFTYLNEREVTKNKEPLTPGGDVGVNINNSGHFTIGNTKGNSLIFDYLDWVKPQYLTPSGVNEMCFSYKETRHCITIPGKEVLASAEKKNYFTKAFIDSSLEDCVSKSTYAACDWSNSMYSSIDSQYREDARYKQAFLNLCRMTSGGAGCDNARLLGASDQANRIAWNADQERQREAALREEERRERMEQWRLEEERRDRQREREEQRRERERIAQEQWEDRKSQMITNALQDVSNHAVNTAREYSDTTRRLNEMVERNRLEAAENDRRQREEASQARAARERERREELARERREREARERQEAERRERERAAEQARRAEEERVRVAKAEEQRREEEARKDNNVYFPGAQFDSCVEVFYEDFTNFFAFRNRCNEAISLHFRSKQPGNGIFGSWDLKPGARTATGYTRKELDRAGGLWRAYCPVNYIPVTGRGTDWINSPNEAYRCKKIL